jgi:hypothetical protein
MAAAQPSHSGIRVQIQNTPIQTAAAARSVGRQGHGKVMN